MRQAAKALVALCAAATTLAWLAASPASAAFGVNGFDVAFTGPNGETVTQAGSHPFAMTTSFAINTEETPEGGTVPAESIKDLFVYLPPGFAGDQTAVPRCSTLDFLRLRPSLKSGGDSTPSCADGAAVGIATIQLGEAGGVGPISAPIYNLEPPPGKAARLGFITRSVPTTVDVALAEEPPYRLTAISSNTSQGLEVFGASIEIWGVPGDERHDDVRGRCFEDVTSLGITCPAGTAVRPFLTLPRSCTGPLSTRFELASWQKPDLFIGGEALTNDGATPPNPVGLGGCGKIGFGPEIEAQLGSQSAEAASGLDFGIETKDEGLKNPSEEAIAQADIAKLEVTLPQGVTANPSAAEGLGVCTIAQFAAERLGSALGAGCPEAAKLGEIEAKTPLLEDHPLRGSLYLAAPGDNPFGTLLALYLVVRDPQLGVFVKLAGKVVPDPRTGQLVTSFEGLPPYPLSDVSLRMREGPRAPLVTPPGCGTYTVNAEFTPSAGAALAVPTEFRITSGVGGGPCPAGTPPFNPGFDAGTLNNNAGSFSPFAMRLTRRDGDQDLTRFSASLPEGVLAKLAGAEQCPDASLAAAAAKSGRDELGSPSCPASALLGTVQAGAGVGAVLTYVPGKVYLAGPYNGAPLSVAAIVPAVAGPFDVGTVVTRLALRVDPRTAKVSVDGAASDPIPHILAGIPLKVRDIQVAVDRPQFTLNPTSCDPAAIGATLWGGGADVFSTADDGPHALEARFQAANCGALAFKPRLSLELKGGTKRGAFPALRGVYRPRPDEANLSGLVLRLPRSAFLEQGHIRTICTRVQFAAKACPPASVYGRARAVTPLLSEPLTGPIYLRASSNTLPDLVVALRGLIDVEAVARVDSRKGAIRATFTQIPDAPITEVEVNMQGGKKGLIVNSRNLCAGRSRAALTFAAHNEKRHYAQPLVKAAGCKGKGKKRRAADRRGGSR